MMFVQFVSSNLLYLLIHIIAIPRIVLFISPMLFICLLYGVSLFKISTYITLTYKYNCIVYLKIDFRTRSNIFRKCPIYEYRVHRCKLDYFFL